MEEDLKINIKKRGICKAKLTSFSKFLNTLLTKLVSPVIGNPFEKAQLLDLKSRLEKLSDIYSEFDTYQIYIELNHENFDEQLLERERFENTYYGLLGSAQELLDKYLNDQLSGIHKSDTESLHSNGSAHSIPHNFLQSSPRLPSIPIPTFSGHPNNWLEFRDTFKSLIHDNDKISSIEKFHFLRGSLEGKAKTILQNLEISSTNYNIAWELLCDRFDNKSILVNNYLKSLFGISNMSKENASDIRRILDGIVKGVRSLEALSIDVSSWDIIIIYFMCNKLDSVTAREWQEIKSKTDLPTLDEFKTFLKTRAELLETLETGSKEKKVCFGGFSLSCPVCKASHNIINCDMFLKLSVHDRFEKIKTLRLCLNCLKANHTSKECRSSGCRKCHLKHHTLLHYPKKNLSSQESLPNKNIITLETNSEISTVEPNTISMSSCSGSSSHILLSTALVQVISSSGRVLTCRALLDSGSQSNFVTEKLCNTLNIKMNSTNVSVVGINQTTSCIKHKCEFEIQSLHTPFSKRISCLVVPRISSATPSLPLKTDFLNIPKHIKLADPGYATPDSIDILLGVELFYQLLCIGQFTLGPHQPTLQKTRFGWVISGPLSPFLVTNTTHCHFSLKTELHSQLERFWLIEEPPSSLKPILSNDDKECESIFVKTLSRDESGRFIVQIPFKRSPSLLGDSSVSAKRQFFSVERKLQKNPKMKKLYVDFMTEYLNMGHMSLAENTSSSETSYFLQHHGVLNESSLTTRLRVVFNGSVPSDNDISLNDLQYTGPNLQDDPISILLRFRVPNIVVCADVAKMYRMIMVQPEQRSLQKIYWRSEITDPLKVYMLNTVTYGTTSASFLAIRCLKQLGLDFEEKYPEASNIILHSFFVDDLLFGADNVDTASLLSNQVSSILKTAGFQLRKWLSNASEVLHLIEGANITPVDNFSFGDKTVNKTLGLFWSIKDDYLMYRISLPSYCKITKRVILSTIARIYDPLGLVSPCTILAKLILQKLWCEKVGWDDSLPSNIHSLWQRLSEQLHFLNELLIPRQMICHDPISIELHGFCDSSIEAYGACLYLKSVNMKNICKVSLVCAKTKVTPLKVVSVPRLELCGALVLAQLIDVFKQSVNIKTNKICLWTDSSVVISWLSQSPHTMQTFVGNRVAKIQSLTCREDWYHINSVHNPADILSRGMYPRLLLKCDHWWKGPKWLELDSSEWPKSSIQLDILPEIKKQVNIGQEIPEIFPIHKYSNFSFLRRSFAYLWRFYSNCKVAKNLRKGGPLTAEELLQSSEFLLRISQKESFPTEYSALLKGEYIQKGPLSTLNPFIDSQGILRVGGRLKLSQLDFAKKHPAVIYCRHAFTKLLFVFEHKNLLHAGPQQLLASLREHYWPLGGRNLARQIIRNCIKCFKVKPQASSQIMGDLPKDRVKPFPPFYTTGVDYAGPFNLKTKKGRGAKLFKAYICIFVCFSTRAVHLEIVSELTTAAFIATFRRFVSRRGKPFNVRSDNGLNFVGAKSELKELGALLQNQAFSLKETFENEGVHWQFIPARSPNFGGIWEAGVKACKFHLKRIMGNASLTFEEFYTVITQIEATLNSRPLVPVSSDPSDFDVLTPAHFLIGKRLTSLPDPNLLDVSDNRLSRYQHLQKIYQHFWSRWSKEYVVLLQQRWKWKDPRKDIKVGELVIVRDDNLPPLNWKLGRVLSLHPGSDGRCRVVTVQTNSAVIKRAVTKLCVLPLDELA